MTDNDWRDGLLRRLGSLETGMKDLSERMYRAESHAALEDERRKAAAQRLDSLDARIERLDGKIEKIVDGLEDNRRWMQRTVLSILIAAALAFALKGGLVL